MPNLYKNLQEIVNLLEINLLQVNQKLLVVVLKPLVKLNKEN